MGKVKVVSVQGQARFKGIFYTPEELRAFQKALDGVLYVPEARARLAPFDKVPAILARLRDEGIDVHMDEASTEAIRQMTAQEWLDKSAVRERISRIDCEINKATGESLFPFQRTGAEWLATRYGALLADDMGLGKAVASVENVCTESGYRQMGDLQVDDEIIGSNGLPTKVLAVYPQGKRETFRLIFSNERSVRCDLEHLWTVRRVENVLANQEEETLTLGEMVRQGLHTSDGSSRWYVPVLFDDHQVGDAVLYEYRKAFAPVVGLEYLGPMDCVCIKVDAEDELFAVNDFILTHNTRQIIVAIPSGSPVLVVCNSAAKGVWAGELEKCRPQSAGGPRVSVLEGRNNFRWPKANEVVIINYDVLPAVPALHDALGVKGRRCRGELPPEKCGGCKEEMVIGRAPPKGAQAAVTSLATVMGHTKACEDRGRMMVPRPCPGCHPMLDEVLKGTVGVGDEAHYIKKGSSNRTQACRTLFEAVRKKEGRTWLATGTPMENEPIELWSVMQAAGIAHEAFGTFDTFARLFKGKTSMWGYTWGTPDEEVPEIVCRVRRVMLRRMKREVLPDLPTKLYQPVVCEVGKEALEQCNIYLRRMGGIDKVAELIEKEELTFSTMASVRAALAAAKIPAMLDIVKDHEEQDEPLLVFSAHRAPIDLLGKMRGWAKITGDEDADTKKEIAARFQRGELRGLGLTIRAGGTAITLTRASRMLFVDRDWKPTANWQAEDRANRIGSTRGLIVMVLEANHPLDKRVNELLLKKQRLIEASVDAASSLEDAPDAIRAGADDTPEKALLRQEYEKHLRRAESLKRSPTWRRAMTSMEYADQLPHKSRTEMLAKSEAWQVAEDAWLEEDEGLSTYAASEVEYWWKLANKNVVMKTVTLELKP